MKMPVRPEKVEEIKAVWDSPNFKTNAQRLIHLLRHCMKIEYGYTIREFAWGIFPEKMTAPDAESHEKYLAYYALYQMFRRFRKDATNHDIVPFAGLVKDTGCWYYYNMAEDEKGYKEVQLRYARMDLGYDRALARIKDISEMPDADRRILTERTRDEIMREVAERQEKKKRKAKK